MKIIIITDTHANYPALQAALNAIHKEGYDLLVHTGDAIAIGPHPAECLDMLLNTPNSQCLMGNHDVWFARGLPALQPSWMSDGELAHQRWTHAQLDPSLAEEVNQWPFEWAITMGETTLTFMHYAIDVIPNLKPIIRNPTRADLDTLFMDAHSHLVFYGHHHPFSDMVGDAGCRYINPGSLGCHTVAIARYTVVQHSGSEVEVVHREVPYDDSQLFVDFEQRNVPEQTFLRRIFFGDRA
ncbi:MAG: metallophosphoesterase family protein [Chloroflexota bacterium]